MPKLPRVTAKVFASNAPENKIGQFGSALTGTKITTGNIEEIQALPAYETGWTGAVISDRNYPTLVERNGLDKSFSQQIAYILQNGIPEWDSNTVYYINQFCRVNNTLYYSLTDNNTGNNPTTDTTNWKSYGAGSDNKGFTPAMFQPFFSLTKLNHPSLVLANYSWLNSGYESAYNLLVERFNAGEDQTETVGDTTITFRYDSQYGLKIITPEQIENAEAIFASTKQAMYFILDVENTRFKLPRTDIMPQFTSDPSAVGKYNEPALPNAKGNTAQYLMTAGEASGVMYDANVTSGHSQRQDGTNNYTWGAPAIDLSRASSIYKDGATVQPPTTNFLLYFYLGESQIDPTSITGEVLENLNNKADIDGNNMINNLSNDAAQYFAGLSKPTKKTITLTWGPSGSLYTAPANGWFVICGSFKEGTIELVVTNGMRSSVLGNSGTIRNGSIYVPVKNGDTCYLYYAGVTTKYDFLFHYDGNLIQ